MTNEFKKIAVSTMVLAQLLGGGFYSFASETNRNLKGCSKDSYEQQKTLKVKSITSLSINEFSNMVESFKQSFEESCKQETKQALEEGKADPYGNGLLCCFISSMVDGLKKLFEFSNGSYKVKLGAEVTALIDDDKPVSYVITCKNESQKKLEVSLIWTDEKCKGKGYGAISLLNILSYCVANGYDCSLYAVSESVEFYEKFMNHQPKACDKNAFLNSVYDSKQKLEGLSDKYKKALKNLIIES